MRFSSRTPRRSLTSRIFRASRVRMPSDHLLPSTTKGFQGRRAKPSKTSTYSSWWATREPIITTTRSPKNSFKTRNLPLTLSKCTLSCSCRSCIRCRNWTRWHNYNSLGSRRRCFYRRISQRRSSWSSFSSLVTIRLRFRFRASSTKSFWIKPFMGKTCKIWPRWSKASI